MSESLRVGVEVVFNISYLLVVWTLVVLMVVRRKQVQKIDWVIARRFILAFALLALGDTGHVGFRVIAYALGGLEANPNLVGMGALSTAITVTFFYMVMLDIWRVRFQKKLGWFGWLLLAAGVVRLLIMAFPQNNWGSVVPPYDWSLLRNVFLVIQGLGVMFLIMRDATARQDKTFIWIAWMIVVSYAFYTPVILFVEAVPMLGMLMIPKTCAYVAIAIIGFRALYQKSA